MAHMAKTELRRYYFQVFSGATRKCQHGRDCCYAHSVHELKHMYRADGRVHAWYVVCIRFTDC